MLFPTLTIQDDPYRISPGLLGIPYPLVHYTCTTHSYREFSKKYTEQFRFAGDLFGLFTKRTPSPPHIHNLTQERSYTTNTPETNMSSFAAELIETARSIAAPGKGILAADESTGTIGQRFSKIDVENVEENRRKYRELLFTTEGLEEYISGVIMFEETLYQSSKDGQQFVDILKSKGIIPGIKVDKGIKPLYGTNGECVTQVFDRYYLYYSLLPFIKYRELTILMPVVLSTMPKALGLQSGGLCYILRILSVLLLQMLRSLKMRILWPVTRQSARPMVSCLS